MKGNGGLFLTREELAEMEARAEEWTRNPEAMKQWAETQSRIIPQVLVKVIEKSGGRRAAQDISVAVDRLTKLFHVMAMAGMFGGATSHKQLEAGEFEDAEELIEAGD